MNRNITIGTENGITVPSVAVGCMRIADMSTSQLADHISGCLDEGLNFFDHADIYGGGKCEELFGNALKSMSVSREKLILQSKCGIVPGVMYDLSEKYIISAVEGILKRLQTDYLDVLLLHRPDALCDPQEVAEAFDKLYSSGKVRHFGVSNHSPAQTELLRKYCRQEIAVNQLQLSIAFSGMISEGMEVNMLTEGAVCRDGYALDYCRLNDITVQAWSPFQYGFFEGNFIGNREKFPELNDVMEELAEKYGITPTGIAACPLRWCPVSYSTSPVASMGIG